MNTETGGKVALKKVLILILWRSYKDLAQEEIDAIEKAHPGHEIEFRRISPRSAEEHAQICQKLQPDAVLLPREQPIPNIAVKDGIPHIDASESVLRKLTAPLVAQFTRYHPGPE